MSEKWGTATGFPIVGSCCWDVCQQLFYDATQSVNQHPRLSISRKLYVEVNNKLLLSFLLFCCILQIPIKTNKQKKWSGHARWPPLNSIFHLFIIIIVVIVCSVLVVLVTFSSSFFVIRTQHIYIQDPSSSIVHIRRYHISRIPRTEEEEANTSKIH